MKETLLTASRRVNQFVNVDLNKGGLLTEETEKALSTLNQRVEKAFQAQKQIRKFLETFPNATSIPLDYVNDLVNLNDVD